MKPVLIYGMPRTRSTAAMQACKRAVKLNEPFARHNAVNYHSTQWNLILEEMNRPDAVVKIFGRDLAQNYNAREWFNKATTSHEIFNLIRNPRETIFSLLIAQHLGFWKGDEKKLNEIIIDENEFSNIEFVFESFLQFYPKSGRLVTFESLPEEFFDMSQISLEEQNSMSRLHLIKNLDEVEKNVDTMLRYFEAEWKDVTGLNIHTLLP